MSKHTSGPWKMLCVPDDCKLPNGGKWWIYGPPTENGTANIADISACRTEEQQEANAALIASAPELLEALKDAYAELNQLAYLQKDNLAKITLNKIQAVINKAEGAA